MFHWTKIRLPFSHVSLAFSTSLRPGSFRGSCRRLGHHGFVENMVGVGWGLLRSSTCFAYTSTVCRYMHRSIIVDVYVLVHTYCMHKHKHCVITRMHTSTCTRKNAHACMQHVWSSHPSSSKSWQILWLGSSNRGSWEETQNGRGPGPRETTLRTQQHDGGGHAPLVQGQRRQVGPAALVAKIKRCWIKNLPTKV